MTERQKDIICALAECDMCASRAAEKLFMCQQNVSYHISQIHKITGKHPQKFYDLLELLSCVEDMGWLVDANAVRNAHYEPDDIAMKGDTLINQATSVDAVDIPCKMGDVVWGIKKYCHGQQVKQGTVHQMFFGDDMRLCICVKNVCRGEWGKNVFATKEEAEAALAERSDGNGDH